MTTTLFIPDETLLSKIQPLWRLPLKAWADRIIRIPPASVATAIYDDEPFLRIVRLIRGPGQRLQEVLR